MQVVLVSQNSKISWNPYAGCFFKLKKKTFSDPKVRCTLTYLNPVDKIEAENV